MQSLIVSVLALAGTAEAAHSRAVALRSTTLSQDGFGSSKCPCIGFDNVDGTTVVQIDEKTKHDYPLELGGSCKAWDDNRHPTGCQKGQTPGKGNGWCAQQWCYVDPCNCNIPVPPKVSAYLPKATYQNKPVYYSYATCGGKDTWTSEHHKAACVNQKSAGDCAKLDKCGWSGSECLGKEVLGQCSQKMHGFSWGMGNCRCIGIDDREGSLQALIAKDKTMKYPAETGGTCEAWDANRHPDCLKGDAPKWCKQAWCYVDPCSCKLSVPPKTSAYVPEGKYKGRPIYYSYATCGSVDHWTAENHKASCVNQKSEEACGKLKKCGWTGKECLGKDLMEVCEGSSSASAPEDKKTVKAGAWVSSVSLVFVSLCLSQFL